ncbi:MAG: hypothetical protein MJK04_08845 [Psychrosphaera sp.]|nr:hypothetical protein [Psychrosphaera sp.]
MVGIVVPYKKYAREIGVTKMFDSIFELGSSVPWIYRPWAFCLSKAYRDGMRLKWAKQSFFYKLFDIGMSVIFLTLELLLVYFIIS